MALSVENRSGTMGFARKATRRACWHVNISLHVAAQTLLCVFWCVDRSVPCGVQQVSALCAFWRNFGGLGGTDLTCGLPFFLPAAGQGAMLLSALAATHLAPLWTQDQCNVPDSTVDVYLVPSRAQDIC